MKTSRKSPAFIHPSVVNLSLDPYAIRVYLQLVYRGGPSGKCTNSIKRLSDETSIGQRKVRESISLLAEVGLIARVTSPRTNGGSFSNYYVLDRDEWLGKGNLDESSRDSSENEPTSPERTADGSREDPSLGENKSSLKSPSKKGVTASFLPVDPVPSEWLQDPDFVEAWNGWIEVRTKKSNTKRAAVLNSKTLANLTKAEAIETLNKSAASGWRGLFPEKSIQARETKSAREFDEKPEVKIL
jgi:predicted transcriptional regulator